MVGSEPVDFHLTDRRGAYDFVTRTLRRLNYAGLSKADKGVVRWFVAKVTGLSRAQSTRLIGQYRNTGHIRDRRCGATRPFERRYTAADIRLLAEVDETLGGLCGPTTRRVMRRQYEVFGDERFERLAGLSNSHLYRIAVCDLADPGIGAPRGCASLFRPDPVPVVDLIGEALRGRRFRWRLEQFLKIVLVDVPAGHVSRRTVGLPKVLSVGQRLCRYRSPTRGCLRAIG